MITIGLMFNMTFKPGIECSQLMKRHRRQAVMRSVIRHIPGQHHDKRVGAYRPAVAQHIGIMGAAGMFSQQKEPQKGCPHKRQQPELNQLRGCKHPAKAQQNT